MRLLILASRKGLRWSRPSTTFCSQLGTFVFVFHTRILPTLEQDQRVVRTWPARRQHRSSNHCFRHSITPLSTYPDAGYPDRFGPSGKFVENYIKLTCLEITGYRIKYSTMLWLPELQIRILMCCWPCIVVMISFGSNSCTTISLYWLSPSTCFGHLRAHLQEDRLYIHHNWFNVIWN